MQFLYRMDCKYCCSLLSVTSISIQFSLLTDTLNNHCHSFIQSLTQSVNHKKTAPIGLAPASQVQGMASNALFSQLSSIGLVLLLVQVSKRFDLTDPSVIFKIRILFYSVQALYLLICAVIYKQIIKRNDQTPVTQTPQPSPFSTGARPASTVMPAKDYDLSELKKMVQQTVLSTLFMTVLHFKFNFVQPLIFQSIPPMKQLFEAPLTRIYLYGKAATGDLKRPFKVQNPLESLMNPERTEEAAEEEVTTTAPPSRRTAPEPKEEVEELSSEAEGATGTVESSDAEVPHKSSSVGSVRSRSAGKKSRKDL